MCVSQEIRKKKAQARRRWPLSNVEPFITSSSFFSHTGSCGMERPGRWILVTYSWGVEGRGGGEKMANGKEEIEGTKNPLKTRTIVMMLSERFKALFFFFLFGSFSK